MLVPSCTSPQTLCLQEQLIVIRCAPGEAIWVVTCKEHGLSLVIVFLLTHESLYFPLQKNPTEAALPFTIIFAASVY